MEQNKLFVHPSFVTIQTVYYPMAISQVVVPCPSFQVADLSYFCHWDTHPHNGGKQQIESENFAENKRTDGKCSDTEEEDKEQSKTNESLTEEFFRNFRPSLPTRKHRRTSILQRRIEDKKPNILRKIENIADPDQIVIKATPKSKQESDSVQRRSRYIGVVRAIPKYNAFIVIDGLKVIFHVL